MELDYQSPAPSTTTNHDHIYTTLLGVFGFFMLIGTTTLFWVRRRFGSSAEAGNAMFLVLLINGCLLAAVMLVLLIRLIFPAQRKWPTVGINIILLISFPLGTALAIYGFWKVDKKLPRV
jgi:hypothetical protein